MRKIITCASVLAIGLSSVLPAPGYAQQMAARSTAPVDFLVVVTTINAYPNGGQALTDRIRTLVLQDQALAADVARYLQSNAALSPAQRRAVEKGLAEALNRMGILAQVPPDDLPGTDITDGQYFLGWAVVLGMLAVGGVAGYLAYQNRNTVSPN